VRFFGESEAPISSYRAKLRFDRRDVFFGDAIASASKWISETAGLKPAKVPEAAFDPLYSSWYSFHQSVTDKAIEAECAEAAKLGMKTLIVDDGWQSDQSQGYATCGDWKVSKKRFPDFAAHVKRVQAMGFRYMIWYSVPFVGPKSENYARFKGKYLGPSLGSYVLDPRFPEVRQFLCETYAKAMKDWNLDGLKLDFIDWFGCRGEDPAVKENYAGRDIKSLSEAVDVLMKAVYAAVTDVNPDALLEFRQTYVGPGIRQYGNMLRATDCPGDLLANRRRITNLRLTSGETAVHADMLEWNKAETAESAARFVLSSIFGVIQYSVMLRDVPESHRRMIAHWIRFSQEHRETLLKGAFRPHHYAANYPVIEAESAGERIVAVYNNVSVADCGAADKPVYVLNASGKARVAVRLAASAKGVLFDTFGNPAGELALKPGAQDVAIPVSGYLRVSGYGK
jgi:alpha-galactosidase